MNERKRATIDLIQREWLAFERRINAASPQAFDRPAFGDASWRLRDLLAHLVFWQDFGARVAEQIRREGRKPRPEERARDVLGETRELDEINRGVVEAARRRPAGEIVDDLRRAHARLVDALRGCPEELLFVGDEPEDLVRALRPSITHLREHLPHIEAALKEGATTA